MRRYILSLMVIVVFSALGSRSGAVDLSKGFLLDIPEDIAARQFGRVLVSTMTQAESLATSSFRFSGDTLRLLAVLVDWNDRPHTWDAAKFDSMLFSSNIWPGGSVADYIWECSYHKVVTTGTVVPWVNGGTYDANYYFPNLFGYLDGIVDFTQYETRNVH